MKILVEIDLPNVTSEDLKDPTYQFFPLPDQPEMISIDGAGYLTRDPTDGSFYIFKLVQVLS